MSHLNKLPNRDILAKAGEKLVQRGFKVEPVNEHGQIEPEDILGDRAALHITDNDESDMGPPCFADIAADLRGSNVDITVHRVGADQSFSTSIEQMPERWYDATQQAYDRFIDERAEKLAADIEASFARHRRLE